mgnify:CR=1 FL=1
MTVETLVDDARTRTDAEREALAAKLDAFDRFVDRVEDVPVEGEPASSAVAAGGGATRTLTGTSSPDGCRAVRRAFADTVRPHSVADVDDPEPLLEAVRTELSDAVAAALAPNTTPSLTQPLVRAIEAEVDARKRETRVTIRALEREADDLATAARVVDEITAWLVDTDDRPLSDCDFEALRARHERLAAFRERCDARLADRQAVLQAVTSDDADVGVSHRRVCASLYEDFPVDHPVLATLARLDATCENCQRAVRDHLVRRV